jgi:hypothetical protein
MKIMTITAMAATDYGLLRDAAERRGLLDVVSQAVAEGPEAVAALAMAIHSGSGPTGEDALQWASGWACWAVYAHAEGRGPWAGEVARG